MKIVRHLLLAVFLASRSVLAGSFSAGHLGEIDITVRRAIDEQQLVGGIFWLERDAEVYPKLYGRGATVPQSEEMSFDTIFDVASLTKVMATTPAIMLLIERGEVDLEAPVGRYIREFSGQGRGDHGATASYAHLGAARKMANRGSCLARIVTSLRSLAQAG